MNIATTAMWALLSLYFQDILHLGPQLTALIISVQPLMVALLSTPVGRLSDRFDKQNIFSGWYGHYNTGITNTITVKLLIPVFGFRLLDCCWWVLGLGFFITNNQ